jgi:hypothetical protein
MKAYGGVVVQTHVLLALEVVGGEWSASHPGRFTHWERAPSTHWIGGWVDPRVGLDDVEKILVPTVTRTPTPQSSSPLTSRYTDCAIPEG